MDIVGIGTDVVECLRIGRMIERHGELFLLRVFTEKEIRYCQARVHAMQHFAERWAAKEATLKCLGTVWSRGVSWADIEIAVDAAGKPAVALRGATKERAEALDIGEIMISLSHCRAYATAFAIALGA